MRLDLSNYINLDRIPQKYYKPENDFEEYNLSRYEKMPLSIFEQAEAASIEIANDLVKQIKNSQSENKPFVIGVPGGSYIWPWNSLL